MAEPRMRARQKGQQFPTSDLEAYLIAFGDDMNPLPETVRVLDEIITDYVIETCHQAAVSAQLAHRAKIKVDDFKFALRKDPKKLGRVTELLALDKDIKKKRKAFDVEDEVVQGQKDKLAEDEAAAAAAAAAAGLDAPVVVKKKRGRKKKLKVVEPSEADEMGVEAGSGAGNE